MIHAGDTTNKKLGCALEAAATRSSGPRTTLSYGLLGANPRRRRPDTDPQQFHAPTWPPARVAILTLLRGKREATLGVVGPPFADVYSRMVRSSASRAGSPVCLSRRTRWSKSRASSSRSKVREGCCSASYRDRLRASARGRRRCRRPASRDGRSRRRPRASPRPHARPQAIGRGPGPSSPAERVGGITAAERKAGGVSARTLVASRATPWCGRVAPGWQPCSASS